MSRGANNAVGDFHRTSCEACGGSHLDPFMQLVDATEYHYEMVRCRDCGLVQIGWVLEKGKHEAVAYEGLWWKPGLKPPHPRLSPHPIYERVMRWLRKYGARGGRLLDVGCASGGLIWLAREQGFQVCGVDVAPGAVEYVRTELGLPAFRTVEEAAQGEGPFDVVTCVETLYYMRSPLAELRRIRDGMKPGGLLLVKVLANRTWVFSAARRWVGRGGNELVVRHGDALHPHTGCGFYVFSTGNLCRLIERAGFHVVGVHNTLPGFRLIWRWPGPLTFAVRMVMRSVAACVATLTLGRRKIGLCVSVVAVRD
jgi:SAM-dependent methyltransferase